MQTSFSSNTESAQKVIVFSSVFQISSVYFVIESDDLKQNILLKIETLFLSHFPAMYIFWK